MNKLCPLCRHAIITLSETTFGQPDKGVRRLIGCENEKCAFHRGIDVELWNSVDAAMATARRIEDKESVELRRDMAMENGWPQIRLEDGPVWYVGHAYSFDQQRNGHRAYDFTEAVESWNSNCTLF